MWDNNKIDIYICNKNFDEPLCIDNKQHTKKN